MRAVHTLGVAIALAMPALLAAQKITPGTWTGTISPPDNQVMEATFDVRTSGDSTNITMKADGRVIETAGVKVEKDRLLFTFAPGGGNVISCTLLLRDDKSYSGDCVDPQGVKGVITMKPPKQ